MACEIVTTAVLQLCVAGLAGDLFTVYEGQTSNVALAAGVGPVLEVPLCDPGRRELRVVGWDLATGETTSGDLTVPFHCQAASRGADLNGDGVVGIPDFSLLGQSWGCEVVPSTRTCP